MSSPLVQVISILCFALGMLTTQCRCNNLNYARDKEQKCITFICGSDYFPICGSDGQTYPNSCKFGQAKCLNPKLSVFLQGACEDISFPPPGNVASTYDISSSTDTDICGITEECSTEIKDPICGSDGNIYNNYCLFTQAYCQNKNLSVASTVDCVQSPLVVNEKCPNKICPIEEDALCASNGKTYRNNCEFEQIKCYRQDLKILHQGKCDPNTEGDQVSCEWECHDGKRPLCGSDGQTYNSICDFERAQCKDKGLKVYKFSPC